MTVSFEEITTAKPDCARDGADRGAYGPIEHADVLFALGSYSVMQAAQNPLKGA
ncbi:hypothetical protein [Candidatus Binatus sp.]|uniref:hypothetical protein n=1 Tax=Candidatus Binatus sp. TaxID=2811406 RepID=UPI003CC5B203